MSHSDSEFRFVPPVQHRQARRDPLLIVFSLAITFTFSFGLTTAFVQRLG